jgi:tetratricopeptide (TPR) repeat protein
VRKVLSKLAASVNAYEHAHNQNLAFVARFVPPLALPWLSFGPVFALAILGAVRALNIEGKLWLTLMAAAYWSTLVVFFSDIRLRAPLALMLAPLAVLGLSTALRSRGREAMKAALLLVVALVVAHLPVPGAGDLTSAYNLHALILFEAGDYDASERYYRESRQLEGLDSETALLGLAAIALKRGDLEKTKRILADVRDGHYRAAEKYELLGATLLREGRLDDAASAFEKALEITPGLLQTYSILELIYAKQGLPLQAADLQRRFRYAQSFFE